jgi:ketosteroid isomerase-like protein
MYRIVHEPPQPLPAPVSEQLPPWLGSVIGCALEKDPGDRFPTAESMRSALAGGPIDLHAPTPTIRVAAQQPVSSERPAWIPYAIVGVVGVLVVGGLLLASGPGIGGTAASAGAVVVEAPESEEVVPPADSASEPAASAPAPDPAPSVDYSAEIASMIESWRIAWQDEDMGRYMGFYASDFYSNYKSMNRAQWESYKRDLFNKYAYQTVTISSPSISVSGDVATAQFGQEFVSDSYRDYGTKTLSLRRSGGVWLITGEEWHK